jgi:type II secretory pathway component GspD/PulD (secretin)
MHLEPVMKENRTHLYMVILIFTLIFSSAISKPNENSSGSRYMPKNMKYISAQDGIRYLAQTGIGTASKMPNSETILVTADSSELIKARVLLELVDKPQPWVVLTYPVEKYIEITELERQLADTFKSIEFGSFNSPPPVTDAKAVLIDIHKNLVILAAAADQIDPIASELEKLTIEKKSPEENNDQNTTTETPSIKQVQSTDEPKADQDNGELFSRLMESLAEAEKVEAQLKGKPIPQDIQPDQEAAPVAVEEPNHQPVTNVTSIEVDAKPIEFEEDSAAKEPEPIELVTQISEEEKLQRHKSKIVEINPLPKKSVFERRNYKPKPIELENEELQLELPETLKIIELVDLVGKHLDLDLLYDKNELKGEVTLRVQDKIKVGELYPLLESVLKFRGFVMSRKNNLVTIVSDKKAAEIDPIIVDTQIDPKDQIEYGNVIITKIFNLRYIDTKSAKNLLDKMKLGLQIEEIDEAGKLVITGYTYRMPRIEELLLMIDMPGKTKQFRYRQLRFTMAHNLATQVQKLAAQIGTVSITVSAEQQQPKIDPRTKRPIRQEPRSSANSAEPTSVYLDADERTNRILMIGMPDQLEVVETLIDSLDVAQQDLRTLRLYDIQYVGAEEVVDKLSELGIISPRRGSTQQRGSSQRITARDRRNQQRTTAEPQPEVATVLTEEGLVEEPLIVIIESTNSLLVNATAEQHASIITIIGYVDAEPQQTALNYVVYPLENQDPEELAGVLNQLVKETIEETQDKDSKVIRTTTKSRIEDDVTIIADAKTYSLVVYASRKNHQWISTLIRELDEYRPQVLLDVTLVEISKNDEFNYDLNLIESFPDLLTTSGFAGTLVSGTTPVTSSDITSKLLGSHRDRFIDVQSNSGSGTAFYGDKHVNLLLTAVQTKGYGRVLARPKILVDDNEEGEIRTQETTYRTRTVTTVQTTSGEPITSTNTIFDPFDSGISLAIKPHISKGDQLRLEILLERSDFRDTAASLREESPTPPDKITSNVDTAITVPNGKTIILGGLEKLNQSKGGSKVPLLGDIPLVGGLFRGVANSDTQSRLYVFVKAHILRPGEKYEGSDMQKVSLKDRKRFEKYEYEMQKHQDWPGVDPKPMDPVKILEDE